MSQPDIPQTHTQNA